MQIRYIIGAAMLIILFSASTYVIADNVSVKEAHRVQGIVRDKNTQAPIPFAAIHIYPLNTGVTTDDNGYFSFRTHYDKAIAVSISSVGYQTLSTSLLPNDILQHLVLEPSSYALQEIVVSAQEGTKGNSTSLIEKEALTHIQPSSFIDLLQLLPGHSSFNPSLSTPSFMSLRQAGGDANTALGTSFLIDGIRLDNDANLQSGYNSANANARVTTSRGIDMRTLSTDNIESVEIVRGIPSVEHGDLTAGLVKIVLKNGYTPWEARLKTDFTNKLLSVGKGILLPNKGGALNVDVDYASYSPDARTEETNYTRATVSSRYENNKRLGESASLLYKFNFAYTGSFDKVKRDPDNFNKEEYYKNRYNQFRMGMQGKFKFNSFFMKQLEYNLSYAQANETLEEYRLISLGGTIPLVTTATKPGIYDTGYLPNEYNALMQIFGKPISLSAEVKARSEVKLGKSVHALVYGSAYAYRTNRGRGQVYDVERPPFASGQSPRPRDFRDVGALKNLSFFAEDNLSLNIGQSRLRMQAGVRMTMLLGLDKQYKIGGKQYWEPRTNIKFTLPQFQLFGKASSFSLTGGAGLLYKMPTMAQLFPSDSYYDYVQLNYYSQNPDYRFANVRTFVENHTNYDLVAAKNTKYETGFVFTMGKAKLDVTFFYEVMNNGFNYEQDYHLNTYTYYDAGSVPNPSSKPNLSDFTSSPETNAEIFSRSANKEQVIKKGIEYTLDMGKIEAIYTRVGINGAWFKTRYSSTNEQYFSYPHNLILGKPYPYIGVYGDGYGNYSGNEKSQLNTNIRFDTHIPALKMIFTTSIENMWFTSDQPEYYNPLPIGYIDMDNKWHDYTPDMAKDKILGQLVKSQTSYSLAKRKVAMASRLNLKVSKELGQFMRLSCYFNNILTYLPDYTSANGIRVKRTGNPYFGAEISVKF